MRLRSSLFLLSLATAIPLVAFALLAAGVIVRLENDSLVSAAKARNRAAMSAVDAELRGAIDTLRALSVARSLGSDDIRSFDALARSVLGTQPSWTTLLLHDLAGHQIVNAAVPAATPLPERPAAPASIDAAIRTLQPVIENLTPAATQRFKDRLGIPVRVPIVRGDKAAYVLTAVSAGDVSAPTGRGRSSPKGGSAVSSTGRDA